MGSRQLEGGVGGETQSFDSDKSVGKARGTTQYNPWAFARTGAEAAAISRMVRARLRASKGNRQYAYYKIRKALCAYLKARESKTTAWK